MSDFQLKKSKYPEIGRSFLFVIVSLIVLVFLLSGCGAKKKTQEEAHELDPGQQRVADWHALIREKSQAPEMEKLESVNSFFNKLEFVDDLYHW